MTSRERIQKTINGEPADRIPFSLWRHFPGSDETSKGLANAVIELQKKFEFDLVKITPASGYLAEALTGKFTPQEYKEGFKKGTRECVASSVRAPKDWRKLPVLDIDNEILARELETIKLIREGVGKDVPIFQTIPNPLTVAKTIREDCWLDDLKNYPEDMEAGLAIISEAIIKFGNASLAAGADGIFFFTQTASFDLLTEKDYRKFGTPYDTSILKKFKEKDALLMFHIHGLNIMFDLLKDYPVHIMNWHDRRTKPSLEEAQKSFNGTVLGGIDEKGVLLEGTPEDVKKQVRETIQQTGGKKLIIGGGCTFPIDTPEANIKAIKEALF